MQIQEEPWNSAREHPTTDREFKGGKEKFLRESETISGKVTATYAKFKKRKWLVNTSSCS